VPLQQPQQFGPRPNNQQFQQKASTNRCFNCGSADHFIKDCPLSENNQGKDKKRVMQVRQGRINFTTLAELPEGAPIMMGTFSINYKPVQLLSYLIPMQPIALLATNVVPKWDLILVKPRGRT
jgi:hypothetical protein